MLSETARYKSIIADGFLPLNVSDWPQDDHSVSTCLAGVISEDTISWIAQFKTVSSRHFISARPRFERQ